MLSLFKAVTGEAPEKPEAQAVGLATRRNAALHVAPRCNSLERSAARCNALQHVDVRSVI